MNNKSVIWYPVVLSYKMETVEKKDTHILINGTHMVINFNNYMIKQQINISLCKFQ